MILLALVHNIALLVALAVVCQIVDTRWHMRRIPSQLIYGFFFGMAGIVSMMTPLNFLPGIIFDGRSIILSAGAFLGGPVVALVSVAMCGGYRLWLGGDGMAMGLSVIATSAALGVAFYYWRRQTRRTLNLIGLWAFGLLVHGAMLALFGLLPPPARQAAWLDIGIIVMGIYPIATVLIIRIFLDYERLRDNLKALQESEDKFKNFFQHSNVGKSITHLNGAMQPNPAFCHMLGYSPAELDSRTWQSLTHPDDVAMTQSHIDALLSGKHDSTRFTKRFIHKNGSVVWVDLGSNLRRDPDGHPLYLMSSLIDITEHKQVELAMRESRERLAVATQAGNIGVWDWDIPKNQLIWDSSMYALYGLREGEFLGAFESWTRSLHPEDRPFVDAEIQAALHGEREFSPQFRIIRPNGDIRFIKASSETMRDSNGRPLRMIGTNVDITELQRTEMVLDRFFEQSMNLHLICGLDGVIHRANRGWQSILGYPPETLKGRVFLELVHPEDRPAALAELGRLSEGKSTTRFEDRIHHADGSYRLLEWAAVASTADRMVYATATDITDRSHIEMEKTRLESQLYQAQKMESVGRLAGGVAHDFNNMLMSMMNYAELSRDELPDGHPVSGYLGEIIRDAQRSANLTRQLLAFARKETIRPQVLDINDTLANMLKLLRRLIGEDIDLIWKPGTDLGPVMIDPSQMDQLLANLVVNARDAIAGAGTVSIESSKVTIDPSYCETHTDALPGEYALLTVSDDGCGMTPDVCAHLFEPFFTTKEVGQGTGLGLATVYGIVKQNRGFIQVDSEPAQGSIFRVYLPVCQQSVDTHDVVAPAPAPVGHGETILLVEDEVSLRMTCGIFLEALGYKLLSAESPELALTLAAGHPGDIHLLLTDVIMPGMNGRQLADLLLQVRPDVRCLFMSGYTADAIANRGVLDEDINFIQKPFTRNMLAHKVSEVLEA